MIFNLLSLEAEAVELRKKVAELEAKLEILTEQTTDELYK